MGYMVHHAIIVTSGSGVIDAVHAEAVRVFGEQVTPILPSTINEYRSFLIGPDGSKAGWGESDAGDARRERFIEYLDSLCHSDGSGPVDWAEVQYGDEDRRQRVVRASNLGRRR